MTTNDEKISKTQAIQATILAEKLGISVGDLDTLEDDLQVLKDHSLASSFIQPWHAGSEEKCPGCKVYKGQRHGIDCPRNKPQNSKEK